MPPSSGSWRTPTKRRPTTQSRYSPALPLRDSTHAHWHASLNIGGLVGAQLMAELSHARTRFQQVRTSLQEAVAKAAMYAEQVGELKKQAKDHAAAQQRAVQAVSDKHAAEASVAAAAAQQEVAEARASTEALRGELAKARSEVDALKVRGRTVDGSPRAHACRVLCVTMCGDAVLGAQGRLEQADTMHAEQLRVVREEARSHEASCGRLQQQLEEVQQVGRSLLACPCLNRCLTCFDVNATVQTLSNTVAESATQLAKAREEGMEAATRERVRAETAEAALQSAQQSMRAQMERCVCRALLVGTTQPRRLPQPQSHSHTARSLNHTVGTANF